MHFLSLPQIFLRQMKKLIATVSAGFLLAGISSCRRSATKPTGPSAVSSSESDVEVARRQAQALVDKGKDLYQDNQDKQAAESFQQAIKLNPDLAEAHFRLGLAYNALERKPEAEESLKKSIALYKKTTESDPKDADALFNLGEAYSILHLDEEAARAFRQVTKLRPNDEEAFYQLGATQTRLARYEEAATAFSKALEIDPDDYRASEALDNAREGTKRIKEGKKHAED